MFFDSLRDNIKQQYGKLILRIGCLSCAAVLAIGMLSGLLGAACIQTSAQSIPGDIIRLHVIANSDSDQDQQIKLKVRDAVLAASRQSLDGQENPEKVKEIVSGQLAVLEKAANDTLIENGYSYGAKVYWGIYPFPVKSYGNVTLPAGDYQAVRVVLGKGEGHNWWCVMFPPLCFVDETHAQLPESSMNQLSDQSKDLITNQKPKFELRFKIMEMFSK